MSQNLSAIFTGSISNGFSLSQVVQSEQAEDIVIKHLANGTVADKVEITPPSSIDSSWNDDADGLVFVVYGKGLGNGFEVVGPFVENDVAHEFAEENRDEDDEWEIFESDPYATPSDQPRKARSAGPGC